MPVSRSAAAERRGPLLDEGADAFLRVLGLGAHVLGEGLELEGRPEIRALAVVERALGQPDRDRRARRDLPRQLVDRGHQCLGWVHRAHEAEPERLGGVDHLPGEDQLAGLGHADQARQEVRPAPVHVKAALDERLAEARGGRGEPDVAAERDVHARAGGGAVDGGDDGLGGVAHGEEHAVAEGRDAVDHRPLGAALLGLVHGLHVAAGAEALAGAGDHDDAHVVVTACPEHGVVEVVAQRVPERVEALGPIEGEGGDAVLRSRRAGTCRS